MKFLLTMTVVLLGVSSLTAACSRPGLLARAHELRAGFLAHRAERVHQRGTGCQGVVGGGCRGAVGGCTGVVVVVPQPMPEPPKKK